MLFIFARHMFMHFSCIRSFFSSYSKNVLCFVIFSLSLSLSLSDRTSLWHPNRENPLQLKTLFMVPGHPLLIPFFHLISNFVMRRPRRTSLRTFRTVVFIWNARSFCRISPTLLYPKSFRLEDGGPSMGNPRGVRSCSFRSFTPTCMPLIPLCLSLL